MSRFNSMAWMGCLIAGGLMLAQNNRPPIPTDEAGRWKWEQMDQGPFFSSNLRGKVAALKTLTLKVGSAAEPASVNFDTMTLRWNAAWTGGFLRLPKGRDGMEGLPEPWGEVLFRTSNGPGWSLGEDTNDPRATRFERLPDAWGHWRGLHRQGDQVVLRYDLGGVGVLEQAGFSGGVFTRTIQFEGESVAGRLRVGHVADQQLTGVGGNEVTFASGTNGPGVRVRAEGLGSDARFELLGSELWLRVPRHPAHRAFRVSYAAAGVTMPAVGVLPDLREGLKPGGRIWGEPMVTRGRLGTSGGEGPYVVDAITWPDDNPQKSWLRFGGFDFFSDATRAAICSVSGDVWLVSGLDAELGAVRWQRYASGLFQPLGLKIVRDEVYVLGRDQITRLKDLNGDGEADVYENFNNDMTITDHYHEFCLGLETDRAGNFYFNKGGNLGEATIPHHGTLLRVTPDGRELSVVATGLRAPNGIGMGPWDEITTSDNEGNWVPASRVNWMKPGGFYGHVFTAHRNPKPTDHDVPLFWLPKYADNSSGGQVWVTGGRWGAFEGDLLHMSYGTCSLFKVMHEEVDGVRQGGVVRFPLRFESGIMRSRFSPLDGQLYTCGLVIWQSNGARQGAFHRVRYTGKPVQMPRDLRVRKTGVEITFTDALDREAVADLQNWSVERWNYNWTEKYGSPEFRLSEPEAKGHDSVDVTGAELDADGRTVRLRLASVVPAMQQRIRFALKSAGGAPVESEILHTIHRVPER
jgi:hypothetical protein